VRLIASAAISALLLLAVPAISFAGTPQQVTHHEATILHRGPLIAGPNMSVVITAKYSNSWPTQIVTDCAGALATSGRYPDYAIERYGRKNIGTTTCQNPFGPFRFLPLAGPATRSYYRHLKHKAMLYACRSLQHTGVRHQKGTNRARFRCTHLRAVDSTSGRTVLMFRTHHSKDVKSVVLASDGRMLISYRNRFSRTYYGRVM
jgi:hypothetical protein